MKTKRSLYCGPEWSEMTHRLFDVCYDQGWALAQSVLPVLAVVYWQ